MGAYINNKVQGKYHLEAHFVKNNQFNKEIVLYLSFAFGLPLICVLLTKKFDIFKSGLLNFILYGIEAMTPTLSALSVTMILTGRNGLSSFLHKLYTRSIGVGYILLGVLVPMLIYCATKLVVFLIGSTAPLIVDISSRKLLIILWALIAEETGWRGFLQERINEKFGYIATPFLVGVIWALWHYHFFWLGTMSIPVPLFAIGCIAESYGYYWITMKGKGNIIPASVWHFTGNLFITLFAINPEYNGNSILPYSLYLIFATIMAVIVIINEHYRSAAEAR